jgi:hypothetical protein
VRLSKKTKYTLYGAALAVVSLGTVASVPAISPANSSITIPDPYTSAVPDFSALLTTSPSVPTNVIKALYIPSDAKLRAQINYDRGSGTFDRSIVINCPYSASQLNSFFTSSLKHFGWNIIQDTKTDSSIDIFASIAGDDGHYWEVGIKTPFKVTNSGGQTHLYTAPQERDSTNVQLRILQMSFD